MHSTLKAITLALLAHPGHGAAPAASVAHTFFDHGVAIAMVAVVLAALFSARKVLT